MRAFTRTTQIILFEGQRTVDEFTKLGTPIFVPDKDNAGYWWMKTGISKSTLIFEGCGILVDDLHSCIRYSVVNKTKMQEIQNRS